MEIDCLKPGDKVVAERLPLRRGKISGKVKKKILTVKRVSPFMDDDTLPNQESYRIRPDRVQTHRRCFKVTISSAPKYGTGICSVCGYQVALTKNGRIRYHKDYRNLKQYMTTPPRCTGIGSLPKPVTSGKVIII